MFVSNTSGFNLMYKDNGTVYNQQTSQNIRKK